MPRSGPQAYRARHAIRRLIDDAIPGSDLVRAGLADLAAARLTIEALLVLQARERLRGLGDGVPDLTVEHPEARMHELIEGEVGPRRAHARDNALRRRLVSFIHAAPIPSSGR